MLSLTVAASVLIAAGTAGAAGVTAYGPAPERAQAGAGRAVLPAGGPVPSAAVASEEMLRTARRAQAARPAGRWLTEPPASVLQLGPALLDWQSVAARGRRGPVASPQAASPTAVSPQATAGGQPLGVTPAKALNWGDNQFGELGAGFPVGSASGPNGGAGNTAPAKSSLQVPAAGITDAVGVAGGHGFLADAFAWTSTGAVSAWGGDCYGALGTGSRACEGVGYPAAVKIQFAGDLTGVVQVAAGWDNTMFLRSDGTVWTAGTSPGNSNYQGFSTYAIPTQGIPGTVVQVAAGNDSDYALTSTGAVYAWGAANYSGQLGQNAGYPDQKPPVLVPGLPSNVTSIGAGSATGYALTSTGTVWAWGENGNGELGNGTTSTAANPVPVQVSVLTGISSIPVSSDSNGYAIGADGSLWGWGSGPNLGNGAAADTVTPVKVTGLSGVVQVTAGIQSGPREALLSSGQVMSWGSNSTGQLGDGNFINSPVPVAVAQVFNVGYVAAAHSTGLAVGQCPTPVGPVPTGQTYGSGGAGSGCGCRSTLGATNPTGMAGDPVDTLTGSQTEQFNDAELPGPGVPFALTRTYNSADPSSGAFGARWSYPFGAHLDATAPTRPVVSGEDGQQAAFTRAPDGSYTPDPGVNSVLAAVSGGGWTVSSPDRHQLTFNPTGQVTAMTDQSRLGLTLAYTGSVLTSVTDSAGRTATLTWTAGLLRKVTLADGRSITYAYTGNQLTGVTGRAGKTWAYAYDSGGRLAQVTDPNGHIRFSDVYDSTTGRVSSQRDGRGGTTTFGWDPATTTATVTSPAGRVTTDVYANGALTSRTTAAGTTRYTYDNDYNLASTTSPNRQLSTFAYDTRGNKTSAVTANGAATQSWTYDDQNHLLSQVDARDLTTTYRYDTAGRLASVTDPNNRTTSMTYATGNQVATVTDPAGKTSTFGYDTAGNRTAATSALQSKTTFGFDTAGRLTSRTDPRGNVAGATAGSFTARYTYDTADHLTTATDANGNVTTTSFDDLGNELSIVDAAQNTSTMTYDADNDLATVVRPLATGTGTTTNTYDPDNLLTRTVAAGGQITTYGYDSAGRRTSTIDPDGNAPGATAAQTAAHTSTVGYDADGNVTTTSRPDPSGSGPALVSSTAYDGQDRPVSRTDPNGHTTRYVYDPAGHPTGTTDANNQTATVGYDNAGQPVTSTDPNNRVTTRSYDPDGRLASLTTALGNKTSYGYDADGHLVSSTDPRGNAAGATAAIYTTSYGYDSAGHRTSSTDPNRHTTTWTYDQTGNQLSVTDPNSNATTWTYTALNQLASVHGANPAAGKNTVYVYDPAGNLASRTDPNLHKTTWTYTPTSQPATTVDPLGRTTRYTYDPAGNPTFVATPLEATAPGKGTVTTGYDSLNRPVSVAFSDGTPAWTYGYDSAGQLTRQANGTATDTRTYDPAGHLTALTRTPTSGPVQTFGYTYDNAGNTLTRTRPDGATVNYRYDPDNQPTGLTDGGTITTATYSPAGDLATLTQPGAPATTQTWTYDPARQPTKIVNTQPGKTLPGNTLTYDPAGNLLTETSPATATTTTNASYAYDPANRLIKTCPGASPCTSAATTLAYTYDSVGNRLTSARTSGTTTTTSTYDAADQLSNTVTSGATTSYTYDPLGQQTTAGTQANTYNLARQLTAARTSTSQAAYTYDPAGNRLTATTGTANPATTRYAWDPNTGDPELPDLVDETTPDGTTRATSWLTPTLPTALTRSKTGFTTTQDHPLTDPHHSITALVSAAGAYTANYTYDPNGILTASTGTSATLNQLRYASGHQDPTTGQYNNRARTYDPQQGRFTSTDPLASPTSSPYINNYAYADNNPLTRWDPTGLICLGYHANSSCLGSGVFNAAIMSGPATALADLLTHGPTGAVVSTIQGFSDLGSLGLTQIAREAISPGSSCYVDKNAAYYVGAAAGVAAVIYGTGGIGGAAEDGEGLFASRLRAMRADPDRGSIGAGTPRTNIAQNKQFNDAIKAAERQLGRTLSKDERSAVHREISGQDYGYHDIVDEVLGMFGGGG